MGPGRRFAHDGVVVAPVSLAVVLVLLLTLAVALASGVPREQPSCDGDRPDRAGDYPGRRATTSVSSAVRRPSGVPT